MSDSHILSCISPSNTSILNKIIARDGVQPPVFVTAPLKRIKENLLPSGHVWSVDNICALPITRRSTVHASASNMDFVFCLCSPYTIFLYRSTSCTWIDLIFPLKIVLALHSRSLGIARYQQQHHVILIAASWDINSQVTAWKFHNLFYPYSVFPRQSTYFRHECSCREASSSPQHNRRKLLHHNTALQQDFVEIRDDKYFGSLWLCPIFTICSDPVRN